MKLWKIISINCSSMGPFHGVQPFRNRLLLHGSPAGSHALPENLFQHEFLSPWVHRSFQQCAPTWASHRITTSFGHESTLAWGYPGAAGGPLFPCGPPWAAGTQLPPMAFHICWKGISAPGLSLPKLCHTNPIQSTGKKSPFYFSHCAQSHASLCSWPCPPKPAHWTPACYLYFHCCTLTSEDFRM